MIFAALLLGKKKWLNIEAYVCNLLMHQTCCVEKKMKKTQMVKEQHERKKKRMKNVNLIWYIYFIILILNVQPFFFLKRLSSFATDDNGFAVYTNEFTENIFKKKKPNNFIVKISRCVIRVFACFVLWFLFTSIEARYDFKMNQCEIIILYSNCIYVCVYVCVLICVIRWPERPVCHEYQISERN